MKRPGFLTRYAKHAGISVRQAAYQLEMCGVNYHAFFDFGEADRRRAEWLANSGGDDNGDEAAGSFAEARTKDRHFKALLSELEYRKRIGELVERSAVEAEFFRIGRQVRDTQKHLPARLCDIFAAETDKRKIYEILEAELTKSHKALALDDGDEGTEPSGPLAEEEKE